MNMQPQMGTEEMPQEEMRSSLSGLMAKIDEKKNRFDTLVNVGNQQSYARKMEEAKMLFETLSQAGVNPSDQQSVNDFLEKLYTENPDLYEIFVPIIEDIISDDTEETEDIPGTENGA